jgi:hypothetical protein
MMRVLLITILGILLLQLTGNSQSDTTRKQMATFLTGETNKPAINTFVKGEKVVIDFFLKDLVQPDTLIVEIKDEYNRMVWRTCQKVKLGQATCHVKAPGKKYGFYKVKAYLAKHGSTLPAIGSRGEGYLTYCVVPDPSERVLFPDTLTRFGMQGNFTVKPSIIPYLGIRWVLTGYDWGKLEPARAGEFEEKYNQAILSKKTYPSYDNNSRGVSYKGKPWTTYALPTLLVNTPRWALVPGTDPGGMDGNFGAILPGKENDWRNYCKSIVKAFITNNPGRGRNIYQITWEPERKWNFTGTPEQLKRIFEVSYQAIHEVDSKAEVVGPTISNFGPEKTKQVDEFFEAGAAPYIDGFSLHPYYETAKSIAVFRSAVSNQLNNVVNKSTGRKTRFYGTEQGYRLTTKGNYQDDLRKARTELLQNITMLGEGASFNMTFYLYDWFLYKPGQYIGYYYNLSDNDWMANKISPKPSAPVYAASSFLLEGHVSKGSISNLGENCFGYCFKKIDGSDIVLVLWNDQKSEEVSINAGKVSAIQVFDWMGNKTTKKVVEGKVKVLLGSEPVYVKGVDKAVW